MLLDISANLIMLAGVISTEWQSFKFWKLSYVFQLNEIDVSESSKQIDYDDADVLVELFKDVTDFITVAKNVTISTSQQLINGMS